MRSPRLEKLMASRPTEPAPVTGRVDGSGRLIAADPSLQALQRGAGSSLGEQLAIPQLAAIARMARELRIPVSRRVIAADCDSDIDMWVRALAEGEEVVLTIEQWVSRPPSGARLASLAGTPLDSSPQAARWAVDGQLRIVEFSQAGAELIGVSAAEAVGKPLTRFVALDEAEDGRMPMLEALASRKGFSGQRARRRSDNKLLLLSGEVVTGPGDGFCGFEGSLAVSDDPEPGDDRAGRQQFDDVLRSPLARIIERADQIARRTDGQLRDEYAAYASDIAAAARHMLSILHSMGAEATGGCSTIDLAELVREAAGLVESLACERRIVLAVEPVPVFEAQGDARGVIQILVNLIGNAVRHSPEQAAVSVSFERLPGRSVVHVADDGLGIAPVDQERIFQRFEKGTAGGQGSGLGLAIARRLARSMDGDIELESSPGKGARFSLALPAA